MKIAQAAKMHLENTILPFWTGIKDEKYGGFYGYMGQDLVLDKQAEKGCILNSRILWFFSEAAELLQRNNLMQYADHAYAFLVNHCIDRKNGGIFWSISYDGKPLDTTKHTYNQAFAIYALSAYGRVSGNQDALELARKLFCLIEEHCTDEIGYLEAFTADWQPESNEKLSENGILADKTMNTLLHVFEGYSGLYHATKDPRVAVAMRRILNIYREKIYDPKLHRQLVFFDAQYNSILDLYSYGHDIESSWLIDWGCDLLEDAELSRQIHDINARIGEEVYTHAFDGRSLANECDRGQVDEKRIWWVQAETVVGLVHLWQKFPAKTDYRDGAGNAFRFIEQYMVDRRPGSEWFWAVDKQGAPLPEKPILEPWKCPYHNGRMCMELIRRAPEIEV